MLPVPYAPACCHVHQRFVQFCVSLKYRGSAPLPDSGLRQSGLPSQLIRAPAESSGRSPRIWKMMSSGSVAVPSPAPELVWPAVHADVRFCAIDANLAASPKRWSR